MARFTTRFATAAVAMALASAAGWLLLSVLRAPRELTVVSDGSDAEQELFLDRARVRAGHAPVPGADLSVVDLSGARLVREPIPPEDVRKLFGASASIFTYDPFTYYRFRGGVERRLEFAEHADGYFVQHTSAEGYIEQFDHLPEKRDLFVVVAGDSHTEGLCNTSETFPNRLEALLEERHPGLAIEVLNAGLTGYSFYQYLGVLEKLLPASPQAFVVAFYGGNDFVEVVKPWHYFHHTSPPQRPREYYERLTRVARASSSAVANALNQLLLFHEFPEQVELALAGATEACGEIQRLCAERGIELVFVYIPPAFDRRETPSGQFAEALRELGLAHAELQQYDQLADRLIAVLRERGTQVLDLRTGFPPPRGDYYWSELHVNVRGHRRIADLLLPEIEARTLRGR